MNECTCEHNNKKITILIVFTWRFKHVHTNTLQCLRNLEVECDMAWPPGEKERLTKALRVQFSTHRTDASLSGLTLLQPAVQFFLKVDNIQACGRGAGHLLHPQLTVFCPFSVSVSKVIVITKLEALVYDILPPTTAMTGYTIHL